jgi:hypothetical protein
MDTDSRKIYLWPVLPALDQQTLAFRQEVQGCGGSIGSLCGGGKQGEEMGGEALDAIGAEEVCGIDQGCVEATIWITPQEEFQVEARRGCARLDGFNRQPIQVAQRGFVQLDQLQHHLNERITVGVALQVQRLKDLLKGELLMVVGVDGGGFDLLKELAEGEIS